MKDKDEEIDEEVEEDVDEEEEEEQPKTKKTNSHKNKKNDVFDMGMGIEGTGLDNNEVFDFSGKSFGITESESKSKKGKGKGDDIFDFSGMGI